MTHATFDGEGREIKKVGQLTGLKVRYLPPGAVAVEDKKPAERAQPAKADKKKERKEKKEKKEKKKAAK